MVIVVLCVLDEECDEFCGVMESVVFFSKNGCIFCFILVMGMWYDLVWLLSFNEVRVIIICEGYLFVIGWEDDCLMIEKFDL